MRQLLIPVLLLGSLLSVAPAQEKAIEPAAVQLDRPVDFEKDILPILDNNCIACHNVAISESKLSLEDVESILKGGKRGPAVVAGQPDASWMYTMAARSKTPAMPPLPNKVESKALTPQELGLMKQWILEGAKASSSSSKAAIAWQPLSPQLKAIYSVALSPWGRVVAAGRANRISLYDVYSKQEIARLGDPNLHKLLLNGQPMYGPDVAHRDFVHSLAFSPDGNLLASGGYREIKLWQRGELAPLQQFNNGGEVAAIAVSPDQQWLAVGTAHNLIKLWNLKTNQPGPDLAGHTAKVTGLAFTGDNAKLFSGSEDKTIRIWTLADAKQVGLQENAQPITALVINKEGTRVATAEADNIIRTWDATKIAAEKAAEPPKPLAEAKGHTKPATQLVMLANNTQYLSVSEDGSARQWDINNGGNVRTFNHGAPVTGVAVRPDQQLIVTVSSNGTGKLWQLNNGQMKFELKGDIATARKVVSQTDEQTVATQRAQIADAAVKAAEKNVTDREDGVKKAEEAKVAADKAVEEAKKKAEEANKKLAAAEEALKAKADDAALIKKRDDEKKAAETEDGNYKRAMTSAEAAVRGIERAKQSVETAKAQLEQSKKDKDAADQRKTAMDEALKALQAQLAQPGAVLQAVSFTPDGSQVVAIDVNGLLCSWGADDGLPADSVPTKIANVTELTYVGTTLITAGKDQHARVWNPNPTWNLVATLGAKAEDTTDVSESPFVDRVLCLDFSHDGKFLAAGGGEPSRSGEILIWDVEKRTLLKALEEPHSDTVLGLQYSWDDKYLVSGAADKFVKLFDVAAGKLVRSYEGHTNHVLDVSIKADNSLLVSAGADNVIKVWNTETGEQARTISTSNKQVTAIQFVGTGENTVSGGGDKTVRLHRSTNGQNFRSFTGPADFIYAVAASRDESVVVGAGEDGILRAWNGKTGALLSEFAPPAVEPKVTAQAMP